MADTIAAGLATIPLPEVRFSAEIAGAPQGAVVRVHATEALSELYECALELATEALDFAPESLLGQPGVIALSRGFVEKRVCGMVVAAEDRGVTADRRVYEVTLAPALWLLSQRVDHRVFQDLDAVQVVKEVLRDAGLYQDDGALEERLQPGQYPVREYCVQYGESDLAFVRRLLEEEGIAFFFEHDGLTETLVLVDAASPGGFPAVVTLDGDAVRVMGQGGVTAGAETVRRFDHARQVVPTGVTLRDYDFTRPGATEALTRARPAAPGARALYQYPARYTLTGYDEGAHAYGRANDQRLAGVRYEAAVARERVARGASNVLGFAPGATFELAGHGRDELDGPYLLTRVTHAGSAPEVLFGGGAGGRDEDRYSNRFECVPAGATYRPPQATPRPRALAPQSAVVVAEPGSREEIYTDHYGRVLVRFQWDRPERRTATQKSKRSSCWVRVMQPWAGSGWGAQFTPRVGMEVVVQFLDGDPDRPVVIGCVYNHENAPPVELPAHKTQSALRTHSSPTTGGYNELRFEDLAGREVVSLRAQRDYEGRVLRDRSVDVGRDQRVHVGHDAALAVDNDREVAVGGSERHDVTRNRARAVGGNELVEVDGNRDVMVHKAASLHADETYRLTTDEGTFVEVGGGSGTSFHMVPDEIRAAAPEKYAVRVGDDGCQLEMTPQRAVVQAPEGIVLQCGESTIEVGPDKITLKTKSGAKVELDGDKISITAGGVVNIKGSQVKSNG